MARRNKTGIRGLYREVLYFDPASGAQLTAKEGKEREHRGDPVRKEDGEWRIDLHWIDATSGQRRRHSERLDKGITAAAARQRALTILNGTTAGTFDPKRTQAKRLGEALDAYEKWCATCNDPQTLASKKGHVQDLKKILGADTKLDDLSPFAIEAFKHKRLAMKPKGAKDPSKKTSPGTVNRGLSTILHAIGKFAEWGWMREAVAMKITARGRIKKLKEPPGRTRELTTEEEARMIAALPVAMKPILRAAVLLGGRRANLALLRKDQVDLERREVTFRKTKNGRALTLPINSSLAELLQACMEGQDSEYVFLSGKRWRTKPYFRPYSLGGVSRAFARTAKKLGIKDVRFHDSRHSWAGRLRRRGNVQLDVLQDLGGWSSLQMVRRYSKIGKKELHEAAALLDEPVSDQFPTDQAAGTEKRNSFQVVK